MARPSFMVTILALAALLGGCAAESGPPLARPDGSAQSQSLRTLDQASRHGDRD